MIKTVQIEVEEHIKKHTKEVIDELCCDHCGKSIPFYKYDKETFKAFEVMTGHHDWGNDSCDSIEYHQFCCIECAVEFIKKFYEEEKGSNTAYAEIKFRFYTKGKEY